MEKKKNKIYRIKPIEELKFTDDFIFCRIMKNPEICKGVLERLLKIKIEKINYPKLQKEIRPYYSARGIRMDVYVKDTNRIFDIEIQTTIQKDLPRRMRYYQSMIDVDTLAKGIDYLTLKESYVIFLCTKDPFELGLPIYTLKTICKENKDVEIDDGINKIVFNASAADIEKNLEIKNFLSYLFRGKPSDDFTNYIETNVEKLKINEIFRSDYMMDALPLFDARQAGIEIGEARGERRIQKTAKNFLKKNIPAEIIAECTGLSLEQVNKIKSKLKKS